jgi:hypothetical protein
MTKYLKMYYNIIELCLESVNNNIRCKLQFPTVITSTLNLKLYEPLFFATKCIMKQIDAENENPLEIKLLVK